MKPDYWIDRWKDGNIRFHDADPHRFLIEYFPHLNTRIDDSILVPLCGKSVDMTWIMSHNFDQEEMAGPPFTANRKTIHQLFEKGFSITMLKSELVVNIKPHCKERGLKTLREDVYLLERF